MKLPRVTEVLRYFSSFEFVPKDILTRAADRGTKVHALCAGIAKGNWIPDGMIEPELLGYVNSFKQWSEAQISAYNIIEKRFTSELLGCSGQVDFVARGNDNELYLVDLKTSARHQKTYPVQMAAYTELLRLHNVTVRGAMLVYLSKEGEFPDIKFYDTDELNEELSVFLSALQCWKYFNKGKLNDRKGIEDCGDASHETERATCDT